MEEEKVLHVDSWWASFIKSFNRSIVVVWTRLQVFLGIIWAVLIATDLTPILTNPKYLLAWTIFSGMVTEALRQRTLAPADAVGRE